MSNDKVRAEFEAWANSFFANAPTKYKRDALPKDDPNYGDYASKPLQVAWLAWQASLAAKTDKQPDVTQLVEELEVLLVSGHLPRTWKERLSILLAAHRKQVGGA